MTGGVSLNGSGVSLGNQSTGPTGAAGGSLAGTYPNPTIASNVPLPGSPTTTTQAQADNSTKVATTAYTDTAVANAIAGVNPAVAVAAATTGVLPNTPTYANGVAGVGATLTASSNAALVVDGYTFVAGDRILVKNQAAALQNGVYLVTATGSGILPYILTRALDYNQPSDINNTGAIPVVNGTTNALTSWLLTSTVTAVGTDALTYTQFSISPTKTLSTNLTSGNIFVGSAGNIATGVAMSGDATIDNTGNITVTKTGGVAFAASATTNALNATNISSGTLPAARLPNPSATTLGGIQSIVAVSNQWINSISTSGVPNLVQPNFSNLAGTLAGSQIQSGLFANKPAASAALFYWATDVGNSGTLLSSNGTIWKPATGSAVIYLSAVVPTLHTGDTVETNILIITIPAGMLSANGVLRLTFLAAATGTNNTKTFKMYYSATSGGTNGTVFANLALVAANLSAQFNRFIANRNSVSSQVSGSTGQQGAANSSAANVTLAINSANVSYINCTVTMANAADAGGFDFVMAEWIE